jgi:hypothetical protein
MDLQGTAASSTAVYTRDLCSPSLSQPPAVTCAVSGSSSLLIQPSGQTQVMLLRLRCNAVGATQQAYRPLELRLAELFALFKEFEI